MAIWWGGSAESPQGVPFWHADYLELKTIRAQKTQEGRHHLYLSIHRRILLTVARPKHQNPVFNSANAGNGLNSVPPGFIGWAEAPTSAWPRVEMGSRRRQLKLNEVIRVGPLPTGLMSCRKRLRGTLPSGNH